MANDRTVVLELTKDSFDQMLSSMNAEEKAALQAAYENTVKALKWDTECSSKLSYFNMPGMPAPKASERPWLSYDIFSVTISLSENAFQKLLASVSAEESQGLSQAFGIAAAALAENQKRSFLARLFLGTAGIAPIRRHNHSTIKVC